MQPFNDDSFPEEIRNTGIALSLDHNPRYNKIDAYWGAVNAICESVRNVTAVGATPLAITDCLCFGNPEKPEQMGEFVESVRGLADATQAVTLKDYPDCTLPIIAGNVSFYNESQHSAIPPSPMISCLGVLKDVSKAMTYDLKRMDSLLILIGERKDECGGSVYYQHFGELGSQLPKPNLSTFSNEIHALHHAIDQQLVLAAHDISEGGIAIALAEMSFKNQIGFDVTIESQLSIEKLLFSETGGFVLEVERAKLNRLKALFAEHHVPIFVIGGTNQEPKLKINSVIDLPLIQAKVAFQNGLREKLL